MLSTVFVSTSSFCKFLKFLLAISQVATYSKYPFKVLNAVLLLIIGYDDFKSPAVHAHWQLLKGIGKRGDLYTWQSTAVKVLLYAYTVYCKLFKVERFHGCRTKL